MLAEFFLEVNSFVFYPGTMNHDDGRKKSYPDSAAFSVLFFHAKSNDQMNENLWLLKNLS